MSPDDNPTQVESDDGFDELERAQFAAMQAGEDVPESVTPAPDPQPEPDPALAQRVSDILRDCHVGV